MNERIEKMMLSATKHMPHGYYVPGVYFEQFAELIVQECVDCLKPLSRNHSIVGAAQDTIKKHFGVEA